MSRNGARPKSRRPLRNPDAPTEHMVRSLDDLAEFEEYQTILKSLRKDVKKLTPKELAKKYAPLAQARIISDMLTTDSPQAALAAAKDLLDRVEGKAKETQEVTHRLEKLSEKELDALLQSEEEEVERMAKQFKQ